MGPAAATRRAFSHRNLGRNCGKEVALPDASSLLTILLSGVVSAVTAAYVSYRLTRHKDDIAFMTQKAEDLFIHTEEWLTRLRGHFVTHYALFKNEIDFNQLHQLTINTGKDDTRSYQKMSMTIAIYFPALKKPLADVESARASLNSIIGEYKRAYKGGDTDGPPWLSNVSAQRHCPTLGRV